MAQERTSEILARARNTLDTACLGLSDVRGQPARRLSGLRNLVVFGRAVTNVLQNLRSTESDFDEWYEPWKQNFASDPLMKFFYELRTRILKRGDTGVGTFTHIRHFEFPIDMKKFGPPPKNAKAFFIGDTNGGTGWEVEVSPGAVEKYYVDLPSEIGTSGLYFHEAPGVADCDKVTEAEVVTLSERYIVRLQEILKSAQVRFGGKSY